MKFRIPWNEIIVEVSRSSGAGGQHVNRTNSAVQLRFSITNSLVLSEIEKNLLREKLRNRIVGEDELIVRSEEERDQKRNKESAFLKLNEVIARALHIPKKRVPTKPKKSAIKKRLESKKIHSGIKKLRTEKIKW